MSSICPNTAEFCLLNSRLPLRAGLSRFVDIVVSGLFCENKKLPDGLAPTEAGVDDWINSLTLFPNKFLLLDASVSMPVSALLNTECADGALCKDSERCGVPKRGATLVVEPNRLGVVTPEKRLVELAELVELCSLPLPLPPLPLPLPLPWTG